MSTAVAGTTFRPTPTYTTLRDVTHVERCSLTPQQQKVGWPTRR
jgi:hypothetical protein